MEKARYGCVEKEMYLGALNGLVIRRVPVVLETKQKKRKWTQWSWDRLPMATLFQALPCEYHDIILHIIHPPALVFFSKAALLTSLQKASLRSLPTLSLLYPISIWLYFARGVHTHTHTHSFSWSKAIMTLHNTCPTHSFCQIQNNLREQLATSTQNCMLWT